MDVLAVDSAKDITCEHQDFEIEMRTLRMDVTAVGSVEVGAHGVCTCGVAQ